MRARTRLWRARSTRARAPHDRPRVAALSALVHNGVDGAQGLAEAFYQRWRDDALVVDKWLTLQAANPQPGTLERVQRLPNTRRSPGATRTRCARWSVRFARANTAPASTVSTAPGYRLVGEAVRTLDAINPQIASRLTATFNALAPARTGAPRTSCASSSSDSRRRRALSNDAREIVVARACLMSEGPEPRSQGPEKRRTAASRGALCSCLGPGP
jgi:aminopeptidase N